MRSLWTDWPAIHRRFGMAKRRLVCLDYDGTLTSIVKHPMQARLPPRAKHLLAQLAHRQGTWVALVSGRALVDLKRHVGLSRLIYIGNHGLELQGPRLRYTHPAAQAGRPLLKQLARRLERLLRPVPGAWIEDKGLTLSLHWRGVPPSLHRQFHGVVTQALAPEVGQRRIELTTGKRVIEVRPRGNWHKGTILAWLLQRIPRSRRHTRTMAVYFGDDQTDEAAFRAINRVRGVSVRVGCRPHATAARWCVRSPREVHAALARMLRNHDRAGN